MTVSYRCACYLVVVVVCLWSCPSGYGAKLPLRAMADPYAVWRRLSGKKVRTIDDFGALADRVVRLAKPLVKSYPFGKATLPRFLGRLEPFLLGAADTDRSIALARQMEGRWPAQKARNARILAALFAKAKRWNEALETLDGLAGEGVSAKEGLQASLAAVAYAIRAGRPVTAQERLERLSKQLEPSSAAWGRIQRYRGEIADEMRMGNQKAFFADLKRCRSDQKRASALYEWGRLRLLAGDGYGARRYLMAAASYWRVKDVSQRSRALLKGMVLWGLKAPPIDLMDLSGKPVSLEAMKRSLVVVVFWSLHNKRCLAIFKRIAEVARQFDGAPLRFVGISLDRSKERKAVESFLEKNHVDWPQVLDGRAWEAPVAKAWRVPALPYFVILDGAGRIRQVTFHSNRLVTVLRRLLDEESLKPYRRIKGRGKGKRGK